MIKILILLIVICGYSSEILYLQESTTDWSITNGAVSLSDDKVKLNGSSSVDLIRRGFVRRPKSKLSFDLKHEKHLVSIMGVLTESDQMCHCAFKVRMGDVEIEIGEDRIKLQSLKSELILDSVIIEKESEFFHRGDERQISIEQHDSTVILIVNDRVIFTHKIETVPNFHDISLSSYMGNYVVSICRIESNYDTEMVVNKNEGYIDIPVVFNPHKFNSFGTLHNHHFITWDEGRAGGSALFTSPIADSIVHRGLLEIGAVPGNNLTEKSWTEWKVKGSKESTKYALGTALGISFLHEGTEIAASDIVEDLSGRDGQYVFAGNLEFIPTWHSGCIICLQSCPGSKISNSVYTMADLAQKIPKFKISSATLKKGTQLWARFRVLQ